MTISSGNAVNKRIFIQKMRQLPKNHALLLEIKQFIRRFIDSPPSDKDGVAVTEFIADIHYQLIQLPLWASSSQEEINNTLEGLEKYIMTKIFDRVYSPHGERDAGRNRKMKDHIARLRFLSMEHLDVPSAFWNQDPSYNLAQTELLKMNAYKTPRDKLVCLLNCCKVLAKLIHVMQGPGGADGNRCCCCCCCCCCCSLCVPISHAVAVKISCRF